MKYLNKNIKIITSKNRFWGSENFKVERIINNRMYSIKRNRKEVIIKRQLMDFFDTMGIEIIKLHVHAKGEINDQDNKIQLDLELKPNSFALSFSYVYLVIFLLILSFTSFENSALEIVLTLLGGMLPLIMYFIFLSIGMNSFGADLEKDLIKNLE